MLSTVSAAPALYASYVFWLLAGLADFICHRRTNLPYTSGLTESTLHLLQLALIGSCLALGLAFELTITMVAFIGVLVLAHAIIGYFDTRSAYGLREIGPLEQHIHSVLDMAPLIGLVLSTLMFSNFDKHGIYWRDPPVGSGVWMIVVLPAIVLCGIPAALELLAALKARRDRPT